MDVYGTKHLERPGSEQFAEETQPQSVKYSVFKLCKAWRSQGISGFSHPSGGTFGKVRFESIEYCWTRCTLPLRFSWGRIECYVPSADRYHTAKPNPNPDADDKGAPQDWSVPLTMFNLCNLFSWRLSSRLRRWCRNCNLRIWKRNDGDTANWQIAGWLDRRLRSMFFAILFFCSIFCNLLCGSAMNGVECKVQWILIRIYTSFLMANANGMCIVLKAKFRQTRVGIVTPSWFTIQGVTTARRNI